MADRDEPTHDITVVDAREYAALITISNDGVADVLQCTVTKPQLAFWLRALANALAPDPEATDG